MNRLSIILLLPLSLVVSFARADDVTPPPPPAAANDTASSDTAAKPAPSAEGRELVLNGQTFTLVNSKVDGLVTTFEYALAGERYEDWTQLLTHQVIGLATPVSAEQFASFFRRKVAGTDPNATMTILKSNPSAVVFEVDFPRTDATDAQIMVCLAFPDTKKGVMNVIQYALKPNRLAGNLAELQVRSWQGVLCAKAASAVAGM